MKNRLAASDRRENEPMSPAVAQANNIQTKSIGSRLAEKLFQRRTHPTVKSERVQPDPGPAPGHEGFLGCRPAAPEPGAALAPTELSARKTYPLRMQTPQDGCLPTELSRLFPKWVEGFKRLTSERSPIRACCS